MTSSSPCCAHTDPIRILAMALAASSLLKAARCSCASVPLRCTAKSKHWLMAAVVTTLFPMLVTAFDAYQVFAFLTVMMCLQLVWVKLAVMETKGMLLEQVALRMTDRTRAT